MRTAGAATAAVVLLLLAAPGGAQCPGDTNGDGSVTIAELVAAVSSALNGCPPAPTSTVTASAAPTPTATLPPTPMLTATPTATDLATFTSTGTATVTRTHTATATASSTPTATPAAAFLSLDLLEEHRGDNNDGSFTIIVSALVSDGQGHPVPDGTAVAFALQEPMSGVLVSATGLTNARPQCDTTAYEADTGRVLTPQPGLALACVRDGRALEGAMITVVAEVQTASGPLGASRDVVLPPLPTPTVTATSTRTRTPSVTPTVTRTPTMSLTPIGAHVCTFLKTCSGGSHQDCTTNDECLPDDGTCTGKSKSAVALYAGAFPVPLQFGLGGSASISCGVADASGHAECTCSLIHADLINIPGLGFVCIEAAPTPCPDAPLYCNGGNPVGLSLRADGNIGSCGSTEVCAADCETHCGGLGSVSVSAGCTGYCTAGLMHACNLDADCLPDDGSCSGPDPVGSKDGICQCGCANPSAGAASRPGDFTCNLGTRLVVEAHAPCNGTDVLIDVSSACIPLTTGEVSTLITHANFVETATVPGSGVPAEAIGQPASCDSLRASSLSGLKLRGAVTFFGSTLGDLATGVSVDCQ